MFPIFVTFSNSSICSPSQMTLPTVENSRLEHVRVLFWYQTPISLIALIALVSFSQKLPETLPVCILRFKQDECQGDLEEKDLHKRGKDLHRKENICTERKLFAQKGKDLHRKKKICTKRKSEDWTERKFVKFTQAHRATVSHFEGDVCREHPHLGYWQFFSFWYY